MKDIEKHERTGVDIAALLCGLILAFAAAVGIWVSAGHNLSKNFIQVGVPLVLIGLGVLGLGLSMLQNSRSKKR